jgi:hypothetical protein
MGSDNATPSGEIQQFESGFHIDDVPFNQRELIRGLIESAIDEHFTLLDPDIEVDNVFVYGGFADGSARRMVSDLDLRVVVDGDIHPDHTGWMSQTIKTYVTRQLPQDRLFGYVDPQVYPSWSDAAEGEVVL